MKKRFLFAITIVLFIVTTAVALTACRKKPTEPTVKTIYDVSLGTMAVGTAIEKAVQVEGAENVYLSFTFVVDKGADTYNEVYELAALLDLDDDRNCALSFKNYTDIENIISAEVYYKNGVLYLNKQPAVDRAAVQGVSLSQIASTLATSTVSGQVGTVLQLLPALGDRVFSACERTQEGDKTTYAFTVDYSQIGTTVGYLVSQTGLLNAAEMTKLLGLDDVAEGGSTQLVFVTQNVENVGEVFVSADCRTTRGGVATAKTVQSFSCKVLSDAAVAQPQYQVAMPDNLSSFGYAHPANLNLLGTVTMDVSSASRAAYLGAQPLTLSLSNYRYQWDFSLQSNVDALGKWTANLVFTNQADRSRHVGLYFADQTLYLDLSSLSLGSWQLPAAKVQEIAAELGRGRAAQTLTPQNYRDVIFDLLVDRVEESEKVTYTLKADSIVKLYNAIEETLTEGALCTLPPVAVDGASVVVDTQNNAFRTLTVSASVWGSTVTVVASNPSVGKPVNVVAPEWVATCVNPLTAATITPTARGIVRSYTAAGGNTALVEALLRSVSDEDVDLGDKEIYYYNFAANLAGSGKINAFSVDFDTDHNERVCSLYYHADSPDELFVIMPTVGTETQVVALTVKNEMRYVDFVRAVNGNTEIREDLAECTLSNTQSSLSFTWSNAGLKALLAKAAAFLSAPTVTTVPNDLGLQALRLTLGGDRALRLAFAADRFIEFGMDALSIGDADLSLTTSLKHNAVSYFDQYNLPQSVAVTIGDGSAAPRKLNVALADFGTDWTFAHEPALGSGKQLVTATGVVFGQEVDLSFEVDCTCPSEVTVMDVPTYAAHLEDKTFTFARYSETVSPVDVIGAYRTVKVVVGSNPARELPLSWLHNGEEIAEADWSTPDRREGNQSDFVILPAVKNFFGRMVALDAAGTTNLAGQYVLRLEGARIANVKNAGEYMTLQTYGAHYDPFDPATYDSAELVFQTDLGIVVDGVSKWEWDIDSIRNRSHAEGGIHNGGALYDTAGLRQAMKEKLYALSGKYAVNVNVYNTLGVVENSITVTVRVGSYVIKEVTFEQLADGVAYTKETGDYMGRFAVATRTLTDVPYNFAFAKVAVVTFDNGTTQRFDARDWTTSPLAAVFMFQSYQGDVKLTLGDQAGGRQTLSLHYDVAAEPVDGVAVWGYKNGVKTEIEGSLVEATAATKQLSFTFEHLNPYDYVMPAGLAVHYQLGTQYVEHAFAFEGWNANALWHNNTPYVTTENVYNVAVTITMSFDNKFVSGEWYFAGMVEDADGLYVFDAEDGNFVLYNNSVPAHRNLTRYSRVATPSVVHQKSKSGAYVYYGGSYVPYEDGNPDHSTLDRYTYDTILAVPYVYEENELGDYVYLNGVHVLYDAEKHQGQKRYARAGTVNVFYRKGTDGLERLVLDPNKVDYTCTEAYPALVVVTFEDGTKAVLPAVWDLSALATVSPEEDYTETVGLSIPMAQFLADVYMRIESTKPKYTYYQVAVDGESGEPILDADGFYTDGRSEVTLTLLGTDADGRLVVNDLTSEKRLHDVICGCDQEGCKGHLYFDYGDSTTANARFAVTEWKRLDAIAEGLRQAAAERPDVPLQELSYQVTVIAVAHNIEIEVVVHVQASNMSDVAYTAAGMPLVASSMSSAGATVYSMAADGTALTVDPYVADIFNADNYPKELQFNLGGVVGKAYVDGWDLSALKGVTPYEGATATVYAQINTAFGPVRVAAPLTVKRRKIQSVTIDGSTGFFLRVNAMSAQPFGSDIVEEAGRTIALKTVDVRFENDDLAYHMTMRYDITDYVAPYSAATLNENATVYVGNAAGGYQAIAGYRVLTNDNYIMRVRVPMDDPAYDLLKAYLKDGEGNWDGVIFAVGASDNGTFVTFDDSAAANEAWRALTTANRRLVLSCGYMDETNALHTTDYTAALGEPEDVGVGYKWERATMQGKAVLRLSVWNTVSAGAEHLSTVQYVSTGTDRYVSLTRSMLSLAGVDGESITEAYDRAFTIGDLLAAHTLGVVGELFAVSDLSSAIYAAEDATYSNPLPLDTVMTVGNYVWHIAIGEHTHYTGAVDIAVTITTRALTSVEIRVIDNVKLNDNSVLLSGYTYQLSSGSVLDVSARDNATAIGVAYYDSEDNPLSSNPYLPGTYTVKFVTADAGYRVDLGGGADSFVLTIVE